MFINRLILQILLRVADENTPLRRETRTQQNAEVKFRSTEKGHHGKSFKGNGEPEKNMSVSPDVKHRGRMKNSPLPVGRPKNQDKHSVPSTGRKRSTLSLGEVSKKRLKVNSVYLEFRIAVYVKH